MVLMSAKTTALPFRAVLWSVALAALGYLGLSLWAGWREVVTAVVQVGPLVLLAACRTGAGPTVDN